MLPGKEELSAKDLAKVTNLVRFADTYEFTQSLALCSPCPLHVWHRLYYHIVHCCSCTAFLHVDAHVDVFISLPAWYGMPMPGVVFSLPTCYGFYDSYLVHRPIICQPTRVWRAAARSTAGIPVQRMHRYQKGYVRFVQCQEGHISVQHSDAFVDLQQTQEWYGNHWFQACCQGLD